VVEFLFSVGFAGWGFSGCFKRNGRGVDGYFARAVLLVLGFVFVTVDGFTQCSLNGTFFQGFRFEISVQCCVA